MSEERFRSCVRDSVSKFNEYDRDLDIVTCWESFTGRYRDHFPDFNFDRFPSISADNPEWFEPNFTLYFDERYGIIFETYHDLLEDERLFDQELTKLKALDEEVKFETRSRRLEIPNKFDICLLVDSDISQTFSRKVAEAIEEGDLETDSNVVVLEFDFFPEDEESHYRFRRLENPDQNFRDDILPSKGRLSERLSLGEDERFQHVKIPLEEEFTELKATGLLTNTSPSNLYLACRLWDTVFYNLLDDDEKEMWQKGDPSKSIEKTVSVPDLCDRLNTDYIPGANVKEKWVSDALEFIAIAEEAVQVSDDQFRISYRNLQDHRREFKDTTSVRSDISDLAWLIAEWHCETLVENSARDIVDIISAESYDKADLTEAAGPELGDY